MLVLATVLNLIKASCDLKPFVSLTYMLTCAVCKPCAPTLTTFHAHVRHVTASSNRPAEPRGASSSLRRWAATAATWQLWPDWLPERTRPTSTRSRLTSETCRLNITSHYYTHTHTLRTHTHTHWIYMFFPNCLVGTSTFEHGK